MRPVARPGRDRSALPRRFALRTTLAYAAVGVVSTAHAGQPLVTDDAAVVAPGTCQLEAWAQWSHGQRADWLQPACNVGRIAELDVGAARVHPDGGESSSLVALQTKIVPFERTADGWSFGALLGMGRDTSAPHGGSAYQAYAAKALASWYPRNDLEIDLNVGAANVYGSGTYALAGAALQYAVLPQLQLLAETYRDEPGTGKYQAGLRWIAVPDVLEAYVAYRSRFARADQWIVTAGVRLQSPPFLP